jgi:hypothetical protein
MKKVFLFVAILAGFISAQTGVAAWNKNDANGTYSVKVTLSTQTTDSTTAITTLPFTIPDYNYYFASGVGSYAIKTVGTYSAPNCSIRLQGLYNGTAVAIDTLRAAGAPQSQVDTIGAFSAFGKTAGSYRIYLINTGGAIASGYVELIFTKPQAYIKK